jgi:hypothetical protein
MHGKKKFDNKRFSARQTWRVRAKTKKRKNERAHKKLTWAPKMNTVVKTPRYLHKRATINSRQEFYGEREIILFFGGEVHEICWIRW